MIRKENIFSESIIRMDVFFNVPNVKIPMSFAQEGNLRTATTNLIRVSGESFFPIVRHFFHVSRVPKRILNHKEKSYSQRSKLARGRLRLPRRATWRKSLFYDTYASPYDIRFNSLKNPRLINTTHKGIVLVRVVCYATSLRFVWESLSVTN